MLVKMSGFRFIVKGLPHIGNVLDFLLVYKFKINVNLARDFTITFHAQGKS